jgi:hypothetical protein
MWLSAVNEKHKELGQGQIIAACCEKALIKIRADWSNKVSHATNRPRESLIAFDSAPLRAGRSRMQSEVRTLGFRHIWGLICVSFSDDASHHLK